MLEQIANVLGTTVDDLKSYDTRAPVQELKRLSIENPAYGLALRRLVDKNVSPDELNKFLKGKRERSEE